MKRSLAVMAAAGAAMLAADVWVAAAPPAQPPGPAAWEVISDGVLDQLAKDGKKIGYPGKTGGIAVDGATGDVFMIVCDQGCWKSSDQGKTFARADGGNISGRCETGFTVQTGPKPGELAFFMVYGKAALTADGGKTWQAFKKGHFDVGAVDWAGGAKAIMALGHESGGDLQFSTDAGAAWASLGKGFSPVVGIFDDKTLVAGKGNELMRSTDAGATWTAVKDFQPPWVGVVQVRGGAGYLVSPQGVMMTKDKGLTWQRMGEPVEAAFGPYFGADAKTMIVVTPKGIARSDDAGAAWKVVAPLPPETRIDIKRPWFPNFGWDVANNILYFSTMGKPAYKLILPKPTK